MKKLLLIIFLFFTPAFLFGQSYKYVADSLFYHLDKSGVTTNILYDRVFPLANLHSFNKLQPDTASNKHFRQAYAELYNAAYNNTSWLLPMHIDAVASQIRLDTLGARIPIGICNYQMNVIDTNAIDNNLIYMGVDSLYYDVSPRVNSPFLTISNLIASPLLDSIQGNTVVFYLDNNLFINKSALSITTLQIDFNDSNGLTNVAIGNSYTINYSASGYKVLKFVATMSNATSITTYAVIKIIEPPQELYSRSCNLVSQTKRFESNLSFQGYDESNVAKGVGDYKIYYATNGNCDGVLRKPIIVLDGFDPGDTRNIDDLYKDYLNNAQNNYFANNLRADGYDVVILNFPSYEIGRFPLFGGMIQVPIIRDGGADYIERNARVLMTLINTINSQKEGNEKLVIIGPSMGGLISRYALAYMEQNSMLHHTRLWVSFDSPHQGANIPIGDQRWLDFYGEATGSDDITSKRDGKIGSVAAKQMLIKHYLSPTSDGAPSFRDQFLTNINQLGFPVGDPNQPFRKIALIDGSLGGTEINSPGQKGFTFDVRRWHNIDLWLFKIRYKTYTVASARMYFTPSYGSTNNVFDGWYLFKSKKYPITTPSNTSGVDVAPGGMFDTQRQISEAGDGQIQRVLDIFNNGGGIRFESKFYSVIPNHSFINTKSALAFTGTNQNLSENLSGRSLVCTGETPFDSYFGDFTKNRDHVDLWPEAVEFVREEINGNPQLPLIKNNTLSISGPFQSGSNTTYSVANVPAGATIKWEVTAPYTINGVNTVNPVGVVIPSNNSQFAELVATISTNCSQTKVRKTLVPPTITTALSGGNGDSCGLGTASINVPSGANFVWTSEGDVSIEGLPPGQPYTSTSNTVSISGLYGSISVSFKSYGNTVTTSAFYEAYPISISVSANPMYNSDPLVATINNLGYNYNAIRWYLDGILVDTGVETYGNWNLDCGNHNVSVEIDLECGTTISGGVEVERVCSGGGWWRTMVVYPNPASSYITIAPDSEKQQRMSAAEKVKIKDYEAFLYDVKGKLILKGRSSSLRLQLDTRKLKSDYYYLHIRMDGDKEIFKQQIIIRN